MTLKAFVSESNLPQEDKDLWFSILQKLDDTQIKVFEDFIDNKEENLKFLTENLKTKTTAFKNFDQELLESVLKKEEEF